MCLVVVLVAGEGWVISLRLGLGCHVPVLQALNDEFDNQVPGPEQLTFKLVLQDTVVREVTMTVTVN